MGNRVHIVYEVVLLAIGLDLERLDDLAAVSKSDLALQHVAHKIGLADLTLTVCRNGGIILFGLYNLAQFTALFNQLQKTFFIFLCLISLEPLKAFVDALNQQLCIRPHIKLYIRLLN